MAKSMRWQAHITINGNLIMETGIRLKGTRCQGMSQNMKVPAGPGRLFAYPDYLIVCGEKRYRDNQRDVLTNPVVIFEILSPSTEHYDRSTKFDLYKLIDSFQEYILIAQDEPRVEHWVRLPDGAWRQKVLIGLDAELVLETAPASIALRDLYDRVEFVAAAPE